MLKRIAVVGSGISGVSAAWLLRSCADVHLFEAQSRFGGHTHTYQFEEDEQEKLQLRSLPKTRPNNPSKSGTPD